MARAETHINGGSNRIAASQLSDANAVSPDPHLGEVAPHRSVDFSYAEVARGQARRLGLLLMAASSLFMVLLVAGVFLMAWYLR